MSLFSIIAWTSIRIHIINSQYNFSMQNCHENSDRVQIRFQSHKRCIIKRLMQTKLYSIEFLRAETTSDLSNYHREYPPYSGHSLFQFEGSEVISVLKNSIEYSFVVLNVWACKESCSHICQHQQLASIHHIGSEFRERNLFEALCHVSRLVNQAVRSIKLTFIIIFSFPLFFTFSSPSYHVRWFMQWW